PTTPVLAIPEGTYLIVNNGHMHYHGNQPGYVFLNGDKQPRHPQQDCSQRLGAAPTVYAPQAISLDWVDMEYWPNTVLQSAVEGWQNFLASTALALALVDSRSTPTALIHGAEYLRP